MKAFSYNPNRFRHADIRELDTWLALYRLINPNVSFIDRTGCIRLPVKTAVPAHLTMPKYDPDFNIGYEDCCQQQVIALLQAQDKLDKPLRILYSGGIDSSLIVVSFIKQLGMKETEKRIQLVMSWDSIEENPWLWEKVLRNSRINIVPGELHDSDWDRDRILVGGEFNDQLMGSDIYKDLVRWRGNKILKTRWRPSLINEYCLHKGMDKVQSDTWTAVLSKQCQQAPVPVESFADFWWWINFSCKWNAVYFRLLMHVRNHDIIDQGYLEKYYCQFYGNESFQKWSMVDRTHKHQDTWLSYKWYAKRLICNFLGDDTFMNKVKRGSLWTLLSYKHPSAMIDDQYGFHQDVDIAAVYDQENFINHVE